MHKTKEISEEAGSEVRRPKQSFNYPNISKKIEDIVSMRKEYKAIRKK